MVSEGRFCLNHRVAAQDLLRWPPSPTAGPACCQRTSKSAARTRRTVSSAVVTAQRISGSGSAKGQARSLPGTTPEESRHCHIIRLAAALRPRSASTATCFLAEPRPEVSRVTSKATPVDRRRNQNLENDLRPHPPPRDERDNSAPPPPPPYVTHLELFAGRRRRRCGRSSRGCGHSRKRVESVRGT